MDSNKPRVVTLGFFDGIHLGHAALLRRARAVADEKSLSAAVLTFDQHPDTLVFGAAVPLINSKEDRADLCRRLYGIDECLVAHFDRHMMQMPWDAFITDYLNQKLCTKYVVCGHDFRFGDHGCGTPEMLREKCDELGIGCDVIPKVSLNGVTISSTYIRTLLQRGEIAEANRFLGHPHCLSGTVVHGRELGRTLGTPTANLVIPEGVLVPAFGVYITKVWLGGACWPAVTNIGVRPTVESCGDVTVEPWILGFDGDLYDKKIRVEFYERIRGEKKFSSLDELKEEIRRNAAQTEAYFR